MNNAVFPCKKQRFKNAVRLLKKSVCFLLFLLVCVLLIFNFQIIPALIPFAEAQITTFVTSQVQEIIRDSVGADYDSFVTLNYDTNGNVVSLETNTAKLSRVTSSITQDIAEKLCKYDRLTVGIPIGTLSGGALFTGRGPDISIPIAISPKIVCEIENEFYESGINQTLHRIVAEVDVETYAIIPASSKKFDVEIEYCIAETVIVGKVPDAYTKINRTSDDISESEIDDIYDFGASAD